ncbi:unnamed protein product [Chrysoparadoxa australica]
MWGGSRRRPPQPPPQTSSTLFLLTCTLAMAWLRLASAALYPVTPSIPQLTEGRRPSRRRQLTSRESSRQVIRAVTEKKFDLVLFGASGFVGGIVTEYLLSTYGSVPDGWRWALAGRDMLKLKHLRELMVQNMFFSRSHMATTLMHMFCCFHALLSQAAQTRVVMSTVASSLLDYKLVDACVRAGVHLCDLSAEPFYLKDMIETYHERAVAAGSCIVHSCGFDSIPADLGCLMMVNYLRERFDQPTAEVQYRISPWGLTGGGISGGKSQSLLVQSEEIWSGGMRAMAALSDPFFYVSDGERPAIIAGEDMGPGGLGYDHAEPGWTAPLAYATNDSKVVHRSNSLLGNTYGNSECPFHYRSIRVFSGRILGLIPALLTTLLGHFMGLLALWPPTRALMAKVLLPKLGDGPSRSECAEGSFRIDFIAKGEYPVRLGCYGGVTARGVFSSDHGDGAYAETSKMMTEAALCLALDTSKPTRGGVLTPAVAMGMQLIHRLNARGMQIEVSRCICHLWQLLVPERYSLN